MGEKTGNTGKLKYDFRTEGSCEVQMKNEQWYRCTAREFRSFDGPRRYTVITGPSLKGAPFDEELTTFDYFGPVYVYMTNKVVAYTNTRKVIRDI